MTTTKRVLVYGAAGVQGGAVAEKLLQAGFEVHAFARTEEKAELLRSKGIQAQQGDLNDYESLLQAHQHADIVYLQLPVDYRPELARGYLRNAIAAAKSAQIELLVLNTNVFVPDQTTEAVAIEFKRELMNDAQESGLPVVFLQPTLYLENLFVPGVFNDQVLAYPVPAQEPLAWVSIDDAAQYAVYAIQHPELAGQTIPVIGPDYLTGQQLAAQLGETLGRPVAFHSLATTDFEAALRPLLGEETSAGLAGLYEWIGANSRLLPEPGQSVLAAGLKLTSTSSWFANAVKQGIFK
ncbi:SDR family oxidoreductase [Paenibacillus radicis (ex Gao et al. 2016)]|uniref:NAD(P)-dependent oxidoreductase n=1 Tax=Paenibacillus radicis (ex Gao et al. 2016) TaxID=1737354 RepID=A0A917H5E0_9BACL|nr:NmrA family NAD(P)-binding protein [Paenibacillus radicis (ex Gao et al. 2016)]GGG67975.1 NAD(P)-dependent oxidoreductase [Paenibacillus radicis (ex Gao et al. 2016)]